MPTHAESHHRTKAGGQIHAATTPDAPSDIVALYRRIAEHAQIPIAENGSVVELSAAGARIIGDVPAGITFVDGLAVGDVRDASLRDRRHLAEDGVLIVVATIAPHNGSEVTAPEVIARGFADPGELLDEARDEAAQVIQDCLADGIAELKLIQEHLHDAVGQLVHRRTGRRPMILPVVVEV